MILCNTCGNPLAVGMSLCAACGAPAPHYAETTQRIPPPRSNSVPTEVLPSPRSEVAARNRNPLSSYVIIALLALIAGGGIVALLKLGVKASPTAEPSAVSSNGSNISSASPADPPKPKSETEAQRNLSDSDSASSLTKQPRAPGGTWFVILGSFPKNDYEKASQLLTYVKGLGYDASLIDADNYPGLRGGLWAVVMGPYSMSYAKSVVSQMKSVRADAYAKSGWNKN